MGSEEQEFTIFHAMGMLAEELKNNPSFYSAFEIDIGNCFISEYHKLTKGNDFLNPYFIKELAKNSANRFLNIICNPPIPITENNQP